MLAESNVHSNENCFLDISDFLIFFKLKVLISMWLGHLPGTLLILSKNIFVTSHQVDFFLKEAESYQIM